MARLAVANGLEVHLSDDAGCTWRPAFTNAVALNGSTASVVGREGTNVRVAVITHHASTVVADMHTLRLLVSDDGAESTHLLPPQLATRDCSPTSRCLVRFAPGTNLAVGYAATSGFAESLAHIASTTDGGRTWQAHAAPSAAGRTWPVSDLAIDPRDSAHVLAVAGGRVFASHDRGQTWAPVQVPATLSTRARVLFTPGTKRDAVVADGLADGTALFASHDSGATFAPTGVVLPAEPLRDLAVGPSPGGPALTIAAGGRVFRERPVGTFGPLLRQGGAVDQLVPTPVGLWMRRTGSVLWVDAVSDPEAPPSFRQEPPPSAQPTDGPPGAGRLHSRPGGGAVHVSERLTVPPGAKAATVVTADLAKQPRGLDVFFLMDTSGSMTAKIKPMAEAMGKVVDSLNREGISARFGLGEHGALSFRYRRHADLGTPPEEVQRRLAGLQTSSGEEYHYTSFFQIATGKGMQAIAGGSIPPGQQASFEPGALRLVVHATDETDNFDPEGPDEATALQALRDIGAHHLGIFPYDGGPSDRSRDPVTEALRRYAAGTSTFAPTGGLDCEGDGSIDIREGEPIACAVPGSTGSKAPIATLIERVLLSLSQRQPVSLQNGRTPLAVRVDALDDYRDVDLHEKHAGLKFRVQVSCPPEQQGHEVDVPLFLLVGDVAVATAALPVTCLAASVPGPPPALPESEAPIRQPRVLPVLPPIASAQPALAPSTAAASATAQAPSSASASSSASQSVQATQVGMAVAPDEALQMATEEEEVRFVARQAAPPPTAAGLAIVVLLALLYAAEPRVATSLARTRHWRERRW